MLSKSTRARDAVKEILADGFFGTREEIIEQLGNQGIVITQPILTKILRTLGVAVNFCQNYNQDQWYLQK